MRFLFLCLLIYLGYRVLKSLFLPGQSPPEPERNDEVARVDDVMVKDPFCETYFPKRSGIKEIINGETYFFCSTACRDKYLEQIKKASE
ncbi:MAG: hypothetical protein JW883_14980 [Deltaproteobacteria bacterium]|nr:hypothetical protein [Deltaproteobacteria bacterium]